MELTDICARYDDRLRTEDYADLDASANGLQIGPDRGEVDRVAFAVDAAVATIEAAIEADADLLVAHHGLSWGGFERVTGGTYRRIAPLIEGDLALYVSHLPLDGHQELGNAAGLADLLELTDRQPFGRLGPEHVGQRGRAGDSYSVPALATLLDRELDHGARGVQVLDFGPEEIEDVAVATGSGVDWLDEAAAAGVDALVTGEGKQQAYHEAREAGLNVFLAGHYATETFGVRALQALAEEWGLETTFVDHPTGL
ncbi:Nif3-like dinuclear metal center hexameric protein [Halegenticoccus soli]|uniref:Nif3-like dinuclear metal center hexameric protein n=1 Tax=Halegenticoccus soli TaxID=1985678 RepID=UPI000C6D0335|nr:Nif3-like dinuclear metal center hexameric protein [Halegenticoccus soli]